MSLDNPVTAYLATCGDTVTSCYQRHQPCCLYLDGLKPPHYPVPAIVHPVQITPWFVIVGNKFDTRYVYPS